ncbi:hypothetical protein PSR68_10040 [Fusobacterium nucleatum]|nr:hypothetical protein [Fusobacterium nucleatum]WDD88718.1 hypothetical protein PSR68_10040 [Fusobacterium nucleatum]
MIKENISEASDLSRILSEEEIWELMLFSGYLGIAFCGKQIKPSYK